MITQPINPAHLEFLRVVKAECQICYDIEYIEAAAISDGHSVLHDEGWRTAKIHDTIHDPVYPKCLINLKEEEKPV